MGSPTGYNGSLERIKAKKNNNNSHGQPLWMHCMSMKGLCIYSLSVEWVLWLEAKLKGRSH